MINAACGFFKKIGSTALLLLFVPAAYADFESYPGSVTWNEAPASARYDVTNNGHTLYVHDRVTGKTDNWVPDKSAPTIMRAFISDAASEIFVSSRGIGGPDLLDVLRIDPSKARILSPLARILTGLVNWGWDVTFLSPQDPMGSILVSQHPSGGEWSPCGAPTYIFRPDQADTDGLPTHWVENDRLQGLDYPTYGAIQIGSGEIVGVSTVNSCENSTVTVYHKNVTSGLWEYAQNFGLNPQRVVEGQPGYLLTFGSSLDPIQIWTRDSAGTFQNTGDFFIYLYPWAKNIAIRTVSMLSGGEIVTEGYQYFAGEGAYEDNVSVWSVKAGQYVSQGLPSLRLIDDSYDSLETQEQSTPGGERLLLVRTRRSGENAVISAFVAR